MAGYKGHLVGAAASNAVYVGALKTVHSQWLQQNAGLLSDWQLIVGLFVIAMLFGLWPDVDTNSKGQNIFFGLAFIADILLIVTGRVEAAAYLGLLAMTPIIGKHRGWTHSKLAMILVPLPIVIVPYWHRSDLLTVSILLYGAAVVGYFSHLLLDGLIVKHIRIKG
ncbi:MAG TPA: metal-dependent hydrolase [Chroococcales cyanobacterium]